MRLPKEYGGGGANVIAWIWARTVASPNPVAQGKHVPLISTYWLSTKKGSEARLQSIIDKASRSYHFEVRTGKPKNSAPIAAGTKQGAGGFKCLLTGVPIPFDHVRAEGQEGRLGITMLAIIAEASRGRFYLSATDEQSAAANAAEPSIYPDAELPEDALDFRVRTIG